jgi:hypothetical protein
LNLPGDNSVYRTGVLDVAVAEVSLQRPGIVALVGQLLCVFENEWVARPFPRREGIPTHKRLQ